MLKNFKGFTLMELIIVLFIFVIIGGLALGGLSKMFFAK